VCSLYYVQLSRFDLIYLVLDKPNEETDRRLAKFIVSLYYDKPTTAPPPYTIEAMCEYISYAKKFIHPKISDEAVRLFVRGYVEMRQLGNIGGGKKVITATPRQLESLIRLAEAHARIRFSSVVEREDVDEAIRLMNVATQRAAMDPRTGTIDMDAITTGRSAAERDAAGRLVNEIRQVLEARRGHTVTLAKLAEIMRGQSSIPVGAVELREAVQALQDDGVVRFVERTGVAYVS